MINIGFFIDNKNLSSSNNCIENKSQLFTNGANQQIYFVYKTLCKLNNVECFIFTTDNQVILIF